MVVAILFGHEEIKRLCAFQEQIVAEIGKTKKEIELYHVPEEIDNAVMSQKPEVLKLDFDNVSFMDSSGIGLVMGRYRTISLYGGNLIVSNLSPQFYRIMKLSGIEKIATINKREN